MFGPLMAMYVRAEETYAATKDLRMMFDCRDIRKALKTVHRSRKALGEKAGVPELLEKYE